MVLQVTCALIFSERMLLITQRGEKMNHPLQWEFPGGKMRSGETPENCLIRELWEELDIGVKIHSRLPEVMHNYGEKEICLIPFVCEITSGQIKLSEHRQFAWVHSSELKNYDLLEADAQIIQGILDDQEFSLF